jgi:hypothetical protein
MAVSNTIKKCGQLDDYEKAAWKYGKAKEAIESARAGLLLLGESIRKSRKEKKNTKEGKKVAPAKARFHVSLTKNSFLGGSRVSGFRSDPSWLKDRLLRDLVYEKAMCKGSTGNGLLNAVKAVP